MRQHFPSLRKDLILLAPAPTYGVVTSFPISDHRTVGFPAGIPDGGLVNVSLQEHACLMALCKTQKLLDVFRGHERRLSNTPEIRLRRSNTNR